MEGEHKSPTYRILKGYAFDPSLSLKIDTIDINEIEYKIPWEDDLKPGPVGEYIEVVDYDPTTKKFYKPVDLNNHRILATHGLDPSDGNPQFHQQMVYAVAMTTIKNFEMSLGRKIIWAERRYMNGKDQKSEYVQCLRIYPHALREANAYYSPNKISLLFGYFNSSPEDIADHMPNSLVYTCLSHDIIAHEITHAILDSLFPKYNEATNPDVLAFHEAFADIVALFQHFSFPEVLRHQIAMTRGDLANQNLLGQLAQEFGTAIGSHGSLRDAIGKKDENGVWKPAIPDPSEYQSLTQPHARGSILVAAIFEAFIIIYKSRVRDLIRIYTNGTGILMDGEIHPDMVNRLSDEAAKSSRHVLNMCIRALDYCPPVDITFGDYLRALITADCDLVSDDNRSYRLAFIESFRKRGIYPEDIKTLSVESLQFKQLPPPHMLPDRTGNLLGIISNFLRQFHKRVLYPDENEPRHPRKRMYDEAKLHIVGSEDPKIMGLHERITYKFGGHFKFEDITGLVFNTYFDRYGIKKGGYGDKRQMPGPAFQIENLRIVSRTGPKGNHINHVIFHLVQTARIQVEMNDVLTYKKPARNTEPFKFRGGCTLIFDLNTNRLEYAIKKPIIGEERDKDGIRKLNMHRLERQYKYQMEGRIDNMSMMELYFGSGTDSYMNEPFAFLHNHEYHQ